MTYNILYFLKIFSILKKRFLPFVLIHVIRFPFTYEYLFQVSSREHQTAGRQTTTYQKRFLVTFGSDKLHLKRTQK